MTTISQSVVSENIKAAPSIARNAAVDRARTFLMLVVLLHHAIIPYTYFGHTDPEGWIGFDMMVLANDSFFMAMFFFLSGLFVWPSLAHKKPGVFLCDRLLRLGLPFAIATLTIIPLAYYAIELRQSPNTNLAVFWWKMVTVGPWPSGPVWFVWVLLALDLTAFLFYRFTPLLLDPINRISLSSHSRPAIFFLFLLLATALLYVPARVYFGAGRWFEFGPFSLQASRVLLYPTYFFVGAGVGMANFDRGLLGTDGHLAKSRWHWVVVALLSYCLLWMLIYVKREMLGNPVWLPNWYEAIYGLFFVAFSAATMLAILGYFLRFNRSGFTLLDTIRTDGYGMFLVHYPIALWIQYWLYDFDAPAFTKALITFVLTVLFSWGATAALRAIPGAARVL